MAIKVNIVPSPGAADPSGVNIKIVSEEPEGASVELVARRALNGDIMIFGGERGWGGGSPPKSSYNLSLCRTKSRLYGHGRFLGKGVSGCGHIYI